jgi:hypothetical protein
VGCFRGETAWHWLNSKACYALCFVLPLWAMFPLLHRDGYGIVANVWCAAHLSSNYGHKYLIMHYAFTYGAVATMTLMYVYIQYRLRDYDSRMRKNLSLGLGGYVWITILVWFPQIALYSERRKHSAILAFHLLPCLSAVFYAVLYFRCRERLYKFEQTVTGLFHPTAEISMSFQYNNSNWTSEFTSSSLRLTDVELTPTSNPDNAAAILSDLVLTETGNPIIQRVGTKTPDIEKADGHMDVLDMGIRISSVDMS